MRRPAVPLTLAHIAAACMLLQGCESAPKSATSIATTSPSLKAISIDSITRDYEAHRYSQAFTGAQSLHRRATGSQRRQIAYIAGVSAYQLGRSAQAQRYLAESASSTEPEMAGRSWATLGIIHFDNHDYRQSVAAFKNATSRLTGQDKAEAAYRCAQGYQEIDQQSQARLQLRIARNASTDSIFKARMDRELRSSGYTLQIGAFNKRANAEALAREVHTTPQAVRFGRPHVVQTADNAGQPMYCVHIGSFNSFQSATRAVDQFNIPAFVRPIKPSSNN